MTAYTGRIEIVRLARPTWANRGQVNQLIHELSDDAPDITLARLQEIVESRRDLLFVAFNDQNEIVGMAMLCQPNQMVTGHGWLEDVAVLKAYRGHGIGGRLVQAVIAAARNAGLRNLDLTSKYIRVDARRLYNRLGFVDRTNSGIMRYDLTAE